uniref:sphinganine-1-phosphate aldolase n=1 Tax=Syphacia muris TaxID=451379 RepID=A0A158R679_9BILA
MVHGPTAVAAGAVQLVRNVQEAINHFLRKVEPMYLVMFSICGTIVYIRVRRVLRQSDRPLLERLKGTIFSIARRTAIMQRRLEVGILKTRKELVKTIHKCDKERTFICELPSFGYDVEKILAIARKYKDMCEIEVNKGRVSGALYTNENEKHKKLLNQIFDMYCYSNPLHPEVFPGCRKMEAEVVRIVSDIYHGGSDCCGTMTTGGTESIMLAMLAYRNKAYAEGNNDPEMLVPVTAHAAFDKASQLFGMRIRHIPVGVGNAVDVKAMAKAISSSTCALVASAPCFPSGTIDNVSEISRLGLYYNIPVHVDACLGGFLIPFMDEAGYPLPLFDFRLPGVTSISCDTHKYGYAPKGSSVILYRDVKYLHYQYFCIPEWTGGLYVTPTFAGSRCGSSIALTWATLLLYGREGYVERTKAIIKCAREIADGIRGTTKMPGIKGLELFGSPDLSVVAFTSHVCNIYAIADKMGTLGWNLNTLQNPPAIHICVTLSTAYAGAAQDFLRDLRVVTEMVMNEPSKGNDSATASIYGLAAAIPDKSLVSEISMEFLDACYATPAANYEEDLEHKLNVLQST